MRLRGRLDRIGRAIGGAERPGEQAAERMRCRYRVVLEEWCRAADELVPAMRAATERARARGEPEEPSRFAPPGTYRSVRHHPCVRPTRRDAAAARAYLGQDSPARVASDLEQLRRAAPVEAGFWADWVEHVYEPRLRAIEAHDGGDAVAVLRQSLAELRHEGRFPAEAREKPHRTGGYQAPR